MAAGRGQRDHLRSRQGALWAALRRECASTRFSALYSLNGEGRASALSHRLLGNLVAVPEHKLLFCMIEKNGLTPISVAVADLQGYHHDVDEALSIRSVGGSFPWDYAAMGATAAHLAAPEAYRALAELRLNDSSWRKLVVLRDPVERFLSAFRDKCNAQIGTRTPD